MPARTSPAPVASSVSTIGDGTWSSPPCSGSRSIAPPAPRVTMTGAPVCCVERGRGGLRGAFAGQLECLGLVGLEDRPQARPAPAPRARAGPGSTTTVMPRARGPAGGRDHDLVRDLERQQQHAPGRRLQAGQGRGHRRAIERAVGARRDRDLVLARHVDHDQGHGRRHARQPHAAADIDALRAPRWRVPRRPWRRHRPRPHIGSRLRIGPRHTPGSRSCRPPTASTCR